MEVKNKHSEVSIENLTPAEGHYFFGFYDTTPWNESEEYLLSHRSKFIDRMPEKDDEVEVGFIDTDKKQFNVIGKTAAWNFQQGSRLQWVPSPRNKVIFNIKNKARFGSRIYDLDTKEKKDLSYPIYALSPNGIIALSVNFSRLQRLGGYGYAGFEDKYKDNPAPDQDGIFKVDLENNSQKLIISLLKIANFGLDWKKNSHHYVTHPTFNPSGSRFCFLHRFELEDGGWYTRLLTADTDGSNLFVVAEGTLSHFDWFDEKYILIWGRSKSYLTKARKHKFFTLPIFKPILNFLRSQVRGFIRHKVIGDQYLLFEDENKKSKSVGEGILTEDGHPTRFKNSPWIITDTYPDDNDYRTLILYNIDKGESTDLGKFYSKPEEKHIKEYKEKTKWSLSGMRSDLHPRWNRTGNKVCIDSVHDGKKNIYVVNVQKIVNENS